jgi:hypothetical protein
VSSFARIQPGRDVVGRARGLPGQIGGNSWPFGALGHRLQLIAEYVQPARYPPLLHVGLVGQLAARLTKQVAGLLPGFGDHGLGLVFRDTGDVSSHTSHSRRADPTTQR